MVAMPAAVDLEFAASMLYAWGDETRARADELGLPVTSGIARMIEQQRVFDSKQAGRRGRRRRPEKRYAVKRVKGVMFRLCGKCGHISSDTECPKCVRDPKDVALELGYAVTPLTGRGTQTPSFVRRSMSQISMRALVIEDIVLRAPNWMQKILRRKFQWLQRDGRAAQDMRISKLLYRERVDACLEYVAERIADRSALR